MRWGLKKRRGYPILLCLFLLFIHLIIKRAEPVFVAQCSDYSNTAFTGLVNKCVADMADSGEFNEFFSIVSGSGGRISAVEADTARINSIKSRLLIRVQDTLNADYPAYVRIPLGSISGSYILNSYGPAIKVKIIPISIVNGRLDEVFESVGINQVRHKLYLNISVDMQYRGYAMNEREHLETAVPIAETVICGEVPEYYGMPGVSVPSQRREEQPDGE